jgi:transcription elongation factor SPT6
MSDDASDAAVKTTEEAAGVVEAAGAASEATAAMEETTTTEAAAAADDDADEPRVDANDGSGKAERMDEDEDSDSEDAGIRRRRRKRAMELDEEDYELLEDNQVTGFKRKEKKKRIQTAAEREGASAGAKAPGTIADLERGLFGDDDEEADAGGEAAADEGAAAGAADEAAKPPPAQQGLGYSDDSEDEMDDFIVRDETDGPRETKEERQRRYASAIPGLRRDQLQDAADIFGDTDELHRMFAARNRTGGAKEDVVEELSEDEESDGDELDTFIEKDGATEEDYEQAKAASDARKAAKAARKSAGRKSSGGETKDWASQTFEPSVIKEQMLTAKDDAIRAQDLPERQQLKPRPAHAPTDWGMEAMWIFDRIMGRDSIQNKPTVEGYSLLYGVADYENENDRNNRQEQIAGLQESLPQEEEEEITRCIALLLTLTFDHHLEIPYIVSQRRDDLLPLLRGRAEEARPALTEDGDNYQRLLRRFDVIDAIMEWDERYVKLELRKARIASALEQAANEKGESEQGHVARQCMELVRVAYLDKHVDDAEAKANLFFASLDANSKLRRPGRKTQYDAHVKRGIRDLVNMSGPTAEAFGEAIKSGIPSELMANLTPEDVAKVYFDQGYANSDEVMQAFVNVAATEIGAEPEVRKWFRDEFLGHATITTQPTPEGTDIIDPWHPIAPVKRLLKMPVYILQGEQFAQILEGKRRGLLKVDIGFGDERLTSVIERMEKAYLSESMSDLASTWNEVRRRVIRAALEEHLLPTFSRETASQLALDARDALNRACADGAWNYICHAPWRPANTEDQDIEVRVVAAVSGSPATFVALDSAGELVDFIQCHTLGRNIGGPGNVGGAQMMNQQDEIQALMDFIVQHRPHVCCVGASGMDSKRVKESLNLVVGRIIEEQPRAIPEEVSEIAVHFVDDSVAKLCENAKETKAEMPEQQPSVLRAVALGRGLLNPAAVVASLVSGGEVASLRMCPLQDSMLSKDDRVAIVERQLINLVNQVGVDVNMASAHPWCSVLLRYVGGLGPRKATLVINAVRTTEGGVVDSREDLKSALGEVVFRNAASFLRITEADMLDSTRCHPERYEQAMAIVVNALELEANLAAMDKYERERILQKVFDPKTWEQKVAPLILEEYAEYLESEGAGKSLEALREIRIEFRHPFEELRPPWMPLTAEDEFALLTGETMHTLSAGKLIQCTVKKIEGPRDGRGARAVCTLDSGLTGYVEKYDVSDDQSFSRIEEKVALGQVITARVKPDGVDVHNFSVQLACSSSALHPDETLQWEQHLHYTEANGYYSMVKQPGEVRLKKQKSKKDMQKRTFVPRNIDHPNFQNVSWAEAVERLDTADIGEVIIRPSGRGTKNIDCSIKVYDGVVSNINIKETKKDSGVGNLGLGTPLIIDDEEYEDLDEVMARHIEPIVSNVKHMLKHRKFMRGSAEDIDNALKQQLARNPGIRPYALGVVEQRVNKGMVLFCISFIMSSSGRVHHEYIKVIPAGFYYRKMEFPSVDRMLAYFKVNCSKPPPGARDMDNGGWN